VSFLWIRLILGGKMVGESPGGDQGFMELDPRDGSGRGRLRSIGG
jgi:hypothetical protein